MSFPCTACGACCRRLPVVSPMALADGSCRHLDPGTNLCTVYAQRPLACRVDDVFRQHVAGVVPARVFYLLQANSCVTLDERNAGLPRMVAERLVDMVDAGEPGIFTSSSESGGERLAVAPRESRVQAMLALGPDEVHAGMPHILAVAQELMLQSFETTEASLPMNAP